VVNFGQKYATIMTCLKIEKNTDLGITYRLFSCFRHLKHNLQHRFYISNLNAPLKPQNCN
jgi:hypothetical protein